MAVDGFVHTAEAGLPDDIVNFRKCLLGGSRIAAWDASAKGSLGPFAPPFRDEQILAFRCVSHKPKLFGRPSFPF